jgi:hypothetical protein
MCIELLQERAAAGAQLLDERMPGWWERIDVKGLRLESCSSCILGQLGGFEATAYDCGLSSKETCLFGFDMWDLPSCLYPQVLFWGEVWNALTDCWRAEIAERKVRVPHDTREMVEV